MKQPTPERWNPVQIALHWVVAVLVIAAVLAAWTFVNLERGSAARSAVMTLHESLGLTIFVLAAARLAWRLSHPSPPIPADLTRLEQNLARATHVLLYVVVLGMPISGYIMSVTGGAHLSYFGLFAIPSALPVDKPISAIAVAVHLTTQWAVYALVVLHIAAAFYHHFVLKDGVLRRMLPESWGRRRRGLTPAE
jgi:cytochrome b561